MRLEFISILFAQIAASKSTTPSENRLSYSTPTPTLNHALLHIRQNNANNPCPSSGIACGNLGAPALCCPSQAFCAFDQAGNVACCPSRAFCTGTISSVSNAIATAAATAFVPNAYYPFAFIPTTYSNPEICSSSYSRCQTDFSSCTSVLGAGGNAVTVNGGGGVGVTGPVQGFLGPVSAASVCSSLSQQACYGLQLANCATFTANGGAVATGQDGFVAPNQAVGRRRQGGLWTDVWSLGLGSWGIGLGFSLGVVLIGVRGLVG